MIQAEILCLQKTDDFKGFEAVLMRNLFKRELLCLLPRVLKRLRASAPNLSTKFPNIRHDYFVYVLFLQNVFPFPFENIFLFLERVKSQCGEDIRPKIKCGFLFLGSVKSQNIKKYVLFFLNVYQVSGEDIKLKIIFSSFFLERVRSQCGRYPFENRSQQTLLSFFHVNPQGTGLSTEATTFFVSNAENFVQNNSSQIPYQDTTQVSSTLQVTKTLHSIMHI